MPTGYTAKIKDGISFQEFVLDCSRAFGALITMRDDPDTPIPDEIKPNTEYYDEGLEKAKSELLILKSITTLDATIEADKEYKEELQHFELYLSDLQSLKRKYQEMLKEVEKWQPPTPDHVGLKEFMVEQINKSIDFDCDTSHLKPPKLMTAHEWINKHMEKCLRGIKYCTEERDKEIDHCKGRTEWIQALKRSIEKEK